MTQDITEEKPIFIRGLSRSGGTLMVTMLDAHPDIAMSYELYPTLLEMENGSAAELERYAQIMSKTRNIKQAASKIENSKLRTFILRSPRGGLNNKELAEIFREHINDGMTVNTVDERLHLIARCCRLKMEKEGKKKWGLKCNNRFTQYLNVWPQAYFLNMLRDGRDVLASQLNTGSFKNTPAELGKSWGAMHRAFRQMIQEPNINAYEVKYERLVTESEVELHKICDFLCINYTPELLEYHRKKLTIFKTSHLSMSRISTTVDTSKIDRWKKDLTSEQVEEFNIASGNALQEFGYVK